MPLGPQDIGLVLLMAGLSKRMGAPKLDLPWRGQSLAVYVASTWAQALPQAPKVAVIGPDSPYGDYLLEAGYELALNAEPQKGQAQSIRLGINRLMELRQSPYGVDTCKGVFFSVCDQPLLDLALVEALRDRFEKDLLRDERAIVCPRYEPQGKRGNPVLFSTYWLEELRQLQGDQGGRSILEGAGASHIGELSIEALDGWSRGFDIDTPEAYEKVYRKWGQENR